VALVIGGVAKPAPATHSRLVSPIDMNSMRTVHKIALAKLAYWALHFARCGLAKTDHCLATRRKLNYDLDLSQGIDLSIFLLGRFELATSAALARKIQPGWTVVDIGANIGAHTLHMAELVGENGRVLAFEPTHYGYSKLLRNLHLNPRIASRVSAYQYFLGGEEVNTAPESVYASWPLRPASETHAKHGGQRKNTIGATASCMDAIWMQLGSPKIHMIKIDVDGFECDVLNGARAVIARDKPIFVLELSPYALESLASP
jgi:FkbM family methyltransferase